MVKFAEISETTVVTPESEVVDNQPIWEQLGLPAERARVVEKEIRESAWLNPTILSVSADTETYPQDNGSSTPLNTNQEIAGKDRYNDQTLAVYKLAQKHISSLAEPLTNILQESKSNSPLLENEPPIIAFGTTLQKILRQILTQSEMEIVLKNLEKLIGIHDTDINLYKTHDIQPAQSSFPSLSQHLNHLKELLKNSHTLFMDHGWSGDNSIHVVETIVNGKQQKTSIFGRLLQAIPKEEQQKTLGIAFTLLGQGSAQVSQEKEYWSQEDNAKAKMVLSDMLGINRTTATKDDQNDSSQETHLGHSMGAGTEIYQAAQEVDNPKIPPKTRMLISPSYHQQNEEIDGNDWNNKQQRNVIKVIVAYLIHGTSNQLEQAFGNLPLYGTVQDKIAESIVNMYFLKNSSLPKLVEGYIARFLQNPIGSEKTAIGSAKQKGITDEQWFKILRKDFILAYGFLGDRMCNQIKTLYNFPKVSEYPNDLVPLPYYIFSKKDDRGNEITNHHSHSEEEHQDKLYRMFMLDTYLKTHDSQQLFAFLQKKAYDSFRKTNNLQQFHQQLSEAVGLQQISTALDLDKETVSTYISKRSGIWNQDISAFRNKKLSIIVSLIAPNLLPQTDERYHKLEQLELILSTIQLWTEFAYYNDEYLEARIKGKKVDQAPPRPTS